MTEYYRMPTAAYDSGVGVDRDQERISGVVIMEKGDISPLDGRKQFVDDKTMSQFVALAGEASAKQRARFTHGGPGGNGGEGLGSYLGRWSNARIDGTKVRWDLQLSPRSHDSVKGDIGKYTLDMSESDPDMLGASMVVTLDYQAMRKERRADGSMPIRLRTLHGADIVDTPALASGMFAVGHNEGEEEMSEPQGITKEQFDAGLKTAMEALGQTLTTAILSKVDEKFAAQAKNDEGDEPTADEIRAEGAKRASAIMAFAATSGLNDHVKIAQEAIDANQSVESFKAGLADRLIAQNKLTKDSDDGNSEDPHAKFRAEFKAGGASFAALGIVDEELYVRSRCRDEGLPVPPIKKAG